MKNKALFLLSVFVLSGCSTAATVRPMTAEKKPPRGGETQKMAVSRNWIGGAEKYLDKTDQNNDNKSGIRIGAEQVNIGKTNPLLSSFKERLLPQSSQKFSVSLRQDTTARSLFGRGKGGDLWARLSMGYSLQADDNEQIQNSLNRFLKSPDYFEKIANQASPYLHYIVEEVERRGLPTELALLPAIESRFEPDAVSPVSAAGIWQFMPETGKHYGLRQDEWYDGRRDVIASTQAALNYLEKLNRRFDGDWLNAIAAYNYGENNVEKAMRRNQAQGKPTDFWSLDLPRETRQFVPNLIALSKIIANPKEYGIELSSIKDRPYLKRIEISKEVDLTVAARLAGLSTYELKRLNPAYRRETTGPNGPYHLTLPVDKAESVKQLIAKLPHQELLPGQDVQLAAIDLNQLANTAQPVQRTLAANTMLPLVPTAEITQQHVVKQGEDLQNIATRYRTTIQKILDLNRQIKTDQVKTGDVIIVPTIFLRQTSLSNTLITRRTGPKKES